MTVLSDLFCAARSALVAGLPGLTLGFGFACGLGGVANIFFSAASRRRSVSAALYCSSEGGCMSGSSEKPEFEGFEFPAEYAQCIAQVTASWPAPENNINLSIWHLAGIYPAIGACMTEQIYTLDGRLKALSALLKLRRGPQDLLDKIDKFAERVRKAREMVLSEVMSISDSECPKWCGVS